MENNIDACASRQRIEVSFIESGKIIGVEFSGVAKVTTVGGASPDGSIYGEGQAVLTTKDGETVTWKGMGVGKPKGKGMAISWRGAKSLPNIIPKIDYIQQNATCLRS